MRSKERRQGRRRETREVEDEEPIDLAGRRLPPPTASHRIALLNNSPTVAHRFFFFSETFGCVLSSAFPTSTNF
jgi:hypothetical protein